MSEYHGPISHAENMRMQQESEERKAWEAAHKEHASKGVVTRLITSPSDSTASPVENMADFLVDRCLICCLM